MKIFYVTVGPDQPPVILRHPQDAEIASGHVKLSVKARGSSPLQYLWYFEQNEIPGMLDLTVSLCLLLAAFRGKEIILYY